MSIPMCVCSEDMVGQILPVYMDGFTWLSPENSFETKM